jgi:hypothetical protein
MMIERMLQPDTLLVFSSQVRSLARSSSARHLCEETHA